MAHGDGGAEVSDASAFPELRVVVAERPGVVRLHVVLPDEVPPGTVEVQVAGRDIVVLAEDVDGRPRRSRSLRLSQVVIESGAEADYEPDGTLTVTLRGPSGR